MIGDPAFEARLVRASLRLVATVGALALLAAYHVARRLR